MKQSKDKNVSSSEMTAIYRSAIPEISGDRLSALLASPEGKIKANTFIEKYHYPLVNRKISARAGYLLLEASRLLRSGHYDSVISLASGFSLLLYYIAEKNLPDSSIQYYDTDLEFILNLRKSRIEKIKEKLNPTAYNKLHTLPLNLEKNYISKKQIQSLFPHCQSPIFIAEGITYFLSKNCNNWLLSEIANYSQTAILLDYWPDNIKTISEKFRIAFNDLETLLPESEQARTFWDITTMEKCKTLFPYTDDWTIAEIDNLLSSQCGASPELTDTNQYFPLKLITAEKGIKTPENSPILKIMKN